MRRRGAGHLNPHFLFETSKRKRPFTVKRKNVRRKLVRQPSLRQTWGSRKGVRQKLSAEALGAVHVLASCTSLATACGDFSPAPLLVLLPTAAASLSCGGNPDLQALRPRRGMEADRGGQRHPLQSKSDLLK